MLNDTLITVPGSGDGMTVVLHGPQAEKTTVRLASVPAPGSVVDLRQPAAQEGRVRLSAAATSATGATSNPGPDRADRLAIRLRALGPEALDAVEAMADALERAAAGRD